MNASRLSLFLASLCLAPSVGLAQEIPDSIGLGVAIVPDYDGSADYVARPSLGGRLTFGAATIELRGSGLRADVLRGPISA